MHPSRPSRKCEHSANMMNRAYFSAKAQAQIGKSGSFSRSSLPRSYSGGQGSSKLRSATIRLPHWRDLIFSASNPASINRFFNPRADQREQSTGAPWYGMKNGTAIQKYPPLRSILRTFFVA